MKIRKFVGIAMLSAVSTMYVDAAHAQGTARAEAGQQLVRAQQNGLGSVADAPSPVVSSVDQRKLQEMQAEHSRDSGFGGQTGGSGGTGATAVPAHPASAPHDDCVGPVSFCNIYFGS